MEGNSRGPIVWWERLINTVILMQYKVLSVRIERLLCKGKAMDDGGGRKATGGWGSCLSRVCLRRWVVTLGAADHV